MDYAKTSLGYCTAIFWRILALWKVYPIVLETGQDFNYGLISFNTEILNIFFYQTIYTIYKQQKRLTKIQDKIWYIKLNSTTTKPYVLFQNAIMLLKDKRNCKIKKEPDQSIQIYRCLIRMWCNN